MLMNNSFQHIEQAIDDIGRRYPGSPRQEVILNRLFCHITSRLACHWNEALRPYGLNETLWIALLALYSHPEQALYPSDISDTLDFSRTNATRVSDELVRHGWASRKSCSEDRRKVKLMLTQQGIEFVERMIPISREYLIKQWGDFTPSEKDTLEDLMRKLLTSLGG
jgi:MarR family transcriptional regulator, negative regulator of the multidrug operon emrRAB